MRRTLVVPVCLTIIATFMAVYGSFSTDAEKPKQFVGIFKLAKADFLKNTPKPEDMAILMQHRDYWQKYTDEGVCLMAGHTLNDDDPIGIAVIRADSEKTAKAMMDNCPAVKAGILKVTLYPFEGLERKTTN
jgi:uncharacterized protein YciI